MKNKSHLMFDCVLDLLLPGVDAQLPQPKQQRRRPAEK